MKTFSRLLPILVALVILNNVACTDEAVGPTQVIKVAAHQEYHLLASNWHPNGSGFYVSRFKDMIVNNQAATYSVYLFKDNVKTLISKQAIDLNGERLWAEFNGTNLDIVYRQASGGPLAFASLEIYFEID